MRISSRSRRILELLLRNDHELTAAQIAEEIQVSSRTVHRELAAVEEILRAEGARLLKKSGSGIRLQGDQAALERLARLVTVSEEIEFSPEERQLYLLCLLLESEEPVKLFTLAHESKVTIPTVANDLDDLDQWVQRFGVTLTRRRGYGIELTGQEEQLREMIRQIIRDRFEDTELISSRNELPVHPLDGRLLTLVGQSEMEAVEKILWSWEEYGGSRLSENAYTDLLIRLSIALRRIRAGKTVEAASVPALRQESDAVYLTERLAALTERTFPPAETAYIGRLLRSVQSEDLSVLPADDLILTDTVRSLIEHVQQAMAAEFNKDRSLRDGLFLHLKDALQRLSEGTNIRNPLLDQIKKDYASLFNIVRKAVNRVFTDRAVPDEEVGFLVMHFGASLERLKQLRHNVRAILVCSSGIGSSKLLQIRLQKELPEIHIVDRVSWYEASRTEKDKYDLIISTVDLPINGEPYIKVSPLLTQAETDRLRAFVQTGLVQKRDGAPTKEEKAGSEASTFEQLVSLKTTLDEMVSLIRRFEVVLIKEKSGDLPAILEEACAREEAKGVLTDAGLVAQRLMQREQSGSQMIPGTAVALFHTRGEEITRPSLSLYRLDDALTVEMASPSRLSHFLLMLAPRTLTKEALEVLSEISAMLLDTVMIDLLEAGDEAEIKDYLTIHLRMFFNIKAEASDVQ
ncbi:BglG family transcription antiterminator [Paenibacillus sp. BK720]|uniref:BglG family transcription antiterminator n=1 Tax=Paenibacillus sp. BK720 TaxID=2587092 RepID=UPI00142040EA|nr:BglG family transcription antiterminator [Paenibacillus sp. BK720]NIK71410.1 mannitol operon transcriptional antiterminator [Paenibacillus sp. BK720]